MNTSSTGELQVNLSNYEDVVKPYPGGKYALLLPILDKSGNFYIVVLDTSTGATRRLELPDGFQDETSEAVQAMFISPTEFIIAFRSEYGKAAASFLMDAESGKVITTSEEGENWLVNHGHNYIGTDEKGRHLVSHYFADGPTIR